MLFFRSEEHLQKWLADWNMPRGEVVPLDTAFKLAHAWYSPDRRAPDWRRKTVEEVEALFASLGLTSEFWRLR